MAGDGRYGERKLSIHLCELFLRNFEERGEFSLVGVSLLWVENNSISHFCAYELSFFVSSHVSWGKYLILNSLTALFLLNEVTAEHVAFFCGFCFYILAKALSITLNLVLNHLVGNLYVIPREFVVAIELAVKLWGKSNVEDKSKRSLGIEIEFGRFFVVRERLAEDIEFVFLDIAIEALANDFVHLFSKHGFAILLLDEAGRYFTRTETGNLCLLADIAKLFRYFFFVISRLYHEGQFGIQLVNVCFCNLHNCIVFVY